MEYGLVATDKSTENILVVVRPTAVDVVSGPQQSRGDGPDT